MSSEEETIPSDEELMTRLRQRSEEAAFNRLMAKWEIPIKRMLARMVQNSHEAEDLAQETFVRLYQQRACFREGARFSPWLYAIAANLARNRLRWWRRRPAVSLDAWMQPEPREGRALREIADSSPVGGIEQRERAEAVRAAVAALPVKLREVVVLSEYEGLSNAETGEALGLSAKAVEMKLYRARAILRAYFILL